MRRRAIRDVRGSPELDRLLERNPQVRIHSCRRHTRIAENELTDAAEKAAATG